MKVKAYSALEEIRGALYHTIKVPFNGVGVMCKLKTLNQSEIMSIGAFGIFAHMETGTKNKPVELTRDQKIETLELQHKIAKICMVSPTFEELQKIIFNENNFFEKRKEALEEIREDLKAPGISSKYRYKKTCELNELEMQIYYVLPTDTAVFLLQWGLGLDITPIKDLTEEALLNAAILAKRGNKSPHDFINGMFADYQKNHIDAEAYRLLDKHIAHQEIIKKARKGRR